MKLIVLAVVIVLVVCTAMLAGEMQERFIAFLREKMLRMKFKANQAERYFRATYSLPKKDE